MVKLTRKELQEYIDIVIEENERVKTIIENYMLKGASVAPRNVIKRAAYASRLSQYIEQYKKQKSDEVFVDYITIQSIKNIGDKHPNEEDYISSLKAENKSLKAEKSK